MAVSPLVRYQSLIDADAIIADAAQHAAVRALQELWLRLETTRKPSIWQRLSGGPPAVPGLYLWGGVGRGKTWLMDLFYEQLNEPRKQRTHFHRFMRRVHDGLNKFSQHRDPLDRVAKAWASDCRVLCLDEFFVNDIADAMLLAGLLEGLFARGLTVVTTSNLHPDDLYRDGLQRARFLPAIESIKRHLRVFELEGDEDFRLRILEQSKIFHTPLDEQAQASLEISFERMAAGCELPTKMQFNDRTFQAIRRGDGLIWFEFDELCRLPRSSHDFIEIARSFNTVFISNIPCMSEEDSDAARRFITLVDEFYDRGVKLLVSAAGSVDSLYSGNRLAFEFQRTQSRLVEMQTREYLARPHLP